ncbi:hypothetical protein [Vibrio sp. TRT 17S01]|uniref:hypothetical protein n=1 Tax=Vibrio sp. TRT 17S01 TaxID=3418505 RepID=UPI003CE6BB4C
MKVVPMIFNTEMVKALLDGRKTVTRRPAKNLSFSERVGFTVGDWAYGIGCNLRETMNNCIRSKSSKCPAQIGDLIYVRETFAALGYDDYKEVSASSFEVSEYRYMASELEAIANEKDHEVRGYRWRPSIHMPRRASRLTLKVTDVRIERVQDITEEQAKCEGVKNTVWFSPFGSEESGWVSLGGKLNAEYRNGFATVWDSIYRNWHENPYVWVIEFEVIHKNVDAVLLDAEKEVAA